MSQQEKSEKVWVTGWANRNVYHTDVECQGIRNAKNARKVRRNRFPNFRECKVCKTGSNQFGSYDKDGYDEKTCKLCGETYKNTPAHLRSCDEI